MQLIIKKRKNREAIALRVNLRKRKTKRNNMTNILESTDKYIVKCEPCDGQNSEDTALNLESHANDTTCDPVSTALRDNDLSNKFIKDFFMAYNDCLGLPS